ncbi:hypothetical protein FOZ63_023718, partial [Perkinsus olseni]
TVPRASATSGAQTQDFKNSEMPFKLESVLNPYDGVGDFALWLRDFDTVASASRWNAKQKAEYIVLFMVGSAKDVARQAVDEVDEDAEDDAAYVNVVKALGQAFSLKTHEAWRLLTTRTWD